MKNIKASEKKHWVKLYLIILMLILLLAWKWNTQFALGTGIFLLLVVTAFLIFYFLLSRKTKRKEQRSAARFTLAHRRIWSVFFLIGGVYNVARFFSTLNLESLILGVLFLVVAIVYFFWQEISKTFLKG